MSKKCFFWLILSLVLSASFVYASSSVKQSVFTKSDNNWRKKGNAKEQLAALVRITPGTHHWMPEIAYRLQSLYWAGKEQRWQFAMYQVKSMEKMIKRVAEARPKRKKSIEEFRELVFSELYRSTKTQQWAEFSKSIKFTASQCNACHAKEGFSFITIPAIPPKPNSLVLGYPVIKE